jgi:restriction system protein
MEHLPKSLELVNPLIKVLADAGRPLTNSEIETAIIEKLEIPSSLVSVIHSGSRTELQYRLAWARTKAKSLGKISSPQREIWHINSN